MQGGWIPLKFSETSNHPYNCLSTGRYHDEFHSIFPMGDISSLIPDSEADVCVLEEPEHLNWWLDDTNFEFSQSISSMLPLLRGTYCASYITVTERWFSFIRHCRYRAPFTSKAWVDKFRHVIGIIHTNYLIYTRGYSGGLFKEPLLFYLNQGMCRANCHKIIKLSGTVQCASELHNGICYPSLIK